MVSNLYGRGELEDLGNLSGISPIVLYRIPCALSGYRTAGQGHNDDVRTGVRQRLAVMVVIAAGELFNSSTGPGRGTLAMTGHQRIVMCVTLGSVATSFALGVILIPLTAA